MEDIWTTPNASTSTTTSNSSEVTPKRASRHSRISNDVEHSSFARIVNDNHQVEYKIGDAVIVDGSISLKQKFLHPPPYLLSSSNTSPSKGRKAKKNQFKQVVEYSGWRHEDGLQAEDKVAVITRLYEDVKGVKMALVRWFARPGAVWGPMGPDEEELGGPTLPYELYYTADSTHLIESRTIRERSQQNPFASPHSQSQSSKSKSKPSPSPSKTSSSFISSAASLKTPLHSDAIPISSISRLVEIISSTESDSTPTTTKMVVVTKEMQTVCPTFVVKRVYDVKPISGAGFWGELVGSNEVEQNDSSSSKKGKGKEVGETVEEGEGGWERLRKQGLKGWREEKEGERKMEGWEVEPAMEELSEDEVEIEKERKRKEKVEMRKKKNAKGSVTMKEKEEESSDEDDESEDERDAFKPARNVDDDSSSDEEDSSSEEDESASSESESDEESFPRTPTKSRSRRNNKQLPTPSSSRRGRSSTSSTPQQKKRARTTMTKAPRAIKRRRTTTKQLTSSSTTSSAHNSLPPLLSSSYLDSLPTPLERAKALLHVSATPESLPCREEQRERIRQFVGDAVLARTGGCLYVHGVPGTGKTATVHSVVRELQNDPEMDPFTFVEINGMKISEPTASFSHLWTALSSSDASMMATTNKSGGGVKTKVSPKVALANLEGWFANPDPARKTTVVLVDELDQMLTKRQDVLYNFFNWPHSPHSRLVVIAVANTMDLPERELSGKIRSRLGTNRIPFQPYNWQELKRILEARLSLVTSNDKTPVKLFDDVALQKIAKSVAGISGDARKALDVARRTLDRVALRRTDEGEGEEDVRCTIQDATAAYNDMTKYGPAFFVKRLSLHEKILLLALAQCVRRAGVPDVELDSIISWHDTFLRQTHLLPTSSSLPSKSDLMTLISNLHAMRLIATESQRLDIFQKVRSGIEDGDVFAALREDELLKNHVPHS